MAWSRPLTPAPGPLQAIWKSGYEEVKVSAHPAPQGNTSWWIWGDYSHVPQEWEGANDWCITYFYTKLNP